MRNMISIKNPFREAKIESNMEIFKSIVSLKSGGIRDMNKDAYKAIMHWIRVTVRTLGNMATDYACGYMKRYVLEIPQELKSYFTTAN